jgi:hypothetical protein
MGSKYEVNADTGNTTIAGNVAITGQVSGKLIPFPILPSTTPAGAQTIYCAYHGGYSSGYESSAQVPMPKCRIKRVTINIGSNTLNSASTLTLRKNGASTGVTITIGAGQTGQLSVNCDVQFNEGDLLSIEIVLGGTSGQGLGIRGGVVWLEI